jgi:hypothetical protein
VTSYSEFTIAGKTGAFEDASTQCQGLLVRCGYESSL